MVKKGIEDYIVSKYHFSVASRMLENYSNFEEKRFIVGSINEMAKSASKIILAFLKYESIQKKSLVKNLDSFMKKISKKYLKKEICIDIIKVLEIQKAQKTSPIQFDKKGDMILLIEGSYRIITHKRLKELLESLKKAIEVFRVSGRQI